MVWRSDWSVTVPVTGVDPVLSVTVALLTVRTSSGSLAKRRRYIDGDILRVARGIDSGDGGSSVIGRQPRREETVAARAIAHLVLNGVHCPIEIRVVAQRHGGRKDQALAIGAQRQRSPHRRLVGVIVQDQGGAVEADGAEPLIEGHGDGGVGAGIGGGIGAGRIRPGDREGGHSGPLPVVKDSMTAGLRALPATSVTPATSMV